MNTLKRQLLLWLCLYAISGIAPIEAQEITRVNIPETGGKSLLNQGWIARRASELKTDGNQLSQRPFSTEGWIPAKVPGTVLTTLLENKLYPDPMVSMNNELIPDIFHAGNDFYTFWFVQQFELDPLPEGQLLWLNFRGINYKAEIFLNGKRLNTTTHEGMFLRRSFLLTPYLREKGGNVLAVLVYPPDPPGNPNGGQGGDAQIARNNTMQFTPGWDWIQPVRDRNTGIWDEVSLTVTGAVKVQHPYVVTRVPGVRQPGEKQKEAIVSSTIELENTSKEIQQGMVICETNGIEIKQPVTLHPKEKKEITVKDIGIKNPRLWWPNGIGEQPLYDISFRFESNGVVSDRQTLRYGIREITTDKCPETGGRRFFVNGQKIYMTGGNYIASDWMLRLSPERYRAEVRFHKEMNIRMIRVWGGALLERPEFYEACDEFGILVFQDLWGSGDCNGAWEDPTKLDSRERRQEYPDRHDIFLESVEDQVKMIRNHPSLCLWCGANEWPLAKEIDQALKEELFPRLDPNRLFASYSTDTLFTRNTIGGNGDGPYGIQEKEWFFSFRSSPFNPEAGSVGSPEIEGFQAIMTERELRGFPRGGRGVRTNAAWRYHKELGYGDQLQRYGEITDFETYCNYLQVVNYDQYRSFMEGWASKMWEWYTGILIWKTQNPWTALRGQMYDWYLDVNATLYGTRKGCEPLHPQYNVVSKQVELVNSALGNHQELVVKAELYDLNGQRIWQQEEATAIEANRVNRLFEVPQPKEITGVYFLKLTLLENNQPVTDNIYWLSTIDKDYSSLANLPKNRPAITASLRPTADGYTGRVTITADDNHISFFNRLKVFDKRTGQRLLPVHYSDNYITLMPGDEKTILLDIPVAIDKEDIQLVVDSWTADRIECMK
ncbi:beta-glycosidase [Parabacteroides sp. OttesenSCG-928-N08]|nr:beta-glycosidase [Parabacteroides sp. OttesenSCG-928-N08]